MTQYEAVIGLETHIQLNTRTKIFCPCKADSWGDPPNSNICPVCSGLPGVLPVLNRAVVEKAVILAAAMHAEVNLVSHFDRKNYFYPDLPKGYQITQYDEPIGKGGYMDLSVPGGSARRVRIHKLHLEEDAGKTKNVHGQRLIDFNRCGVPLIEMVTEPDLHSADEAAQYLIQLRQLLRWLGVSEADMEKGHLRCDGNVSIREKGSQVLNTKTEIKNVNSIDALRNAINNEIERQVKEVSAGGRVKAWTLDWDDETQTLKMMRSKETEADYRYFREPDLLPLVLDKGWVKGLIESLPELPLARRDRFISEYGLPLYDADILTGERSLSDYFEETLRQYGGDPKVVSNWMMNEVLRMLNDLGVTVDGLKLRPPHLASIMCMIDEKKINAPTGKALVKKVQASGQTPEVIVQAEGLGLVSDDAALRETCQAVVTENPVEVKSFREGKESLIGWFLGQVMRRTGGKADPGLTRSILLELLRGG